MPMPPHLSQTAQAVASGQQSAADVLEACIARIEATEPRINAFTGTRFEAARAQAARIDAQRARGEPLGPLAGVPFAVKNLFDIEGEVTLAGSKVNRTNPPARTDAALVQRLQAARRDLRLPAELAKLDRFDLLICDDFSYVRRDQGETSVLFELIAERYERKSLAITANQPFSEWGHVFAEPAMTLATVDRLVHHATISEMDVESFRRRVAQKGLAPSEQRNPNTSKPKG